MQSSLLTYIGYITGPRADQPVGVRVVEPPPGTRQYQRGNLYAVVELIGDHPDRTAIADRVLSEVQRTYYTSKGSQSQVLVDALHQAQQLLREVNAHSPYYPLQAGILCSALLGGRLLLVSSGAAFALIRANDKVHMFPSEVSASVSGYAAAPVEVYRQDVQADDAIFLGGGEWLRRLPVRTLASVVAFVNAENCTDAADELFEQGGQVPIPGLLIVLAANHEPPRPGSYPSGPGTPPRSTPPPQRRPRFGGLPTSFSAAPPARLASSPSSSLPSSSFAPESRSTLSPSASQSQAPSSRSSFVEPQPPAARQDEEATWTRPSSYTRSESPPTELASRQVDTPPYDSPSTVTPASSETARRGDSASTYASWLRDSETQLAEPASTLGARAPAPPAGTPPVDTPARSLAVESAPPLVPPAVTSTSFPPPASNEIAPTPTSTTAAGDALRSAPSATTTSSELLPDAEELPAEELPVEPGDEIDPLFPPSTPLTGDERERSPHWSTQIGKRTHAGLAGVRGFLARLMPSRKPNSPSGLQQPDREAVLQEARMRSKRAEMLAAGSMTQAELHQAARRSQLSAQETADRDFDDPNFDDPNFDDPNFDDRNFAHAEMDAPAMPTPVMPMSPFTPPQPTRGARARLLLLVALLILVAVPAVVAAINFGQGNTRRLEAQELTDGARTLLLGAQTSLDEGDDVTGRERLTQAQDYLARAIALDGASDERTQLVANIASELQDVLQVVPLYGLTSPIITFPAEAQPQRVLVMNEDIFVLDSGRQALIQYRFDPTTGIVTDQLGRTVLQQGDVVDGVAVGVLADMAWQPLIPGIEDRPSLLIIDRNNNVFSYDQRVEGATRLPLAGQDELGSLGQIQTYNGRIYMADDARGSILRYYPGAFDVPGEPWFASAAQINLDDLISMEIDGDIWLLRSNGMILRYTNGEQVPFSLESSIGLAEEPVDMYVTRQESATIYLVDAAQERILVYDKDGTYLSQLRAPEGNLLRGLSGLYIDEVAGRMYILTQSGLFVHPLLQ